MECTRGEMHRINFDQNGNDCCMRNVENNYQMIKKQANMINN